MKKRYELRKLNFDSWDEAFDQYLNYKKSTPDGTFDSWYEVRTKTSYITNKIRSESTYNKQKQKTPNKNEAIINEAFTEAEQEIIKMFEELSGDVSKKQQLNNNEKTYVEKIMYEAEKFARRAHAGQTRGDGKPYIEHIEDVVNIIKSNDNSNTPEAIITAWIHDIVTRSPYTHSHLFEFSFITNKMVIAIDELDKDFFESYEQYIHRLKQNELAWVIKLAKMMALIDANPTAEEQFEIEKFCGFLEDES